jgi:chaperonin GroES
MAVKPLDDRVVIEVLEAETTTAGGIVLPDTAKEKPQQGKVVAVGPGRVLDSGERADLEVKVGDVVLFSKYGGDDVEVEGKDCRIMRETDILAVVE